MVESAIGLYNTHPWAGRFSRRRSYAIGDVHGCVKTLRRLIEEQIRPENDDFIVLLGDYIDRGPDSKGVLDYLMELFWRDDINVFPLLGNHEEMLLKAVAGDLAAEKLWYGNGGWGTLQSFGVSQAADIPQKYLDFLKALPLLCWTTKGCLLVHAGLDFSLADPQHDTPREVMLRDRTERVTPCNIDGRTLVCGHTVTPLFEIQKSLATEYIRLDNGCYDKGHMGYGSLVALNLDTRELLVQENCE